MLETALKTIPFFSCSELAMTQMWATILNSFWNCLGSFKLKYLLIFSLVSLGTANLQIRPWIQYAGYNDSSLTYISQKSKALFDFFWREELARSKAPCILQWHVANWLPWMQHHRTVEISRLPFISAKAPYRYKNNISHALPITKIRRIPLVQNASREGIGRLSRDPIIGTKNCLAASPVAQDGGEQNDSPASVPTETLLSILSKGRISKPRSSA